MVAVTDMRVSRASGGGRKSKPFALRDGRERHDRTARMEIVTNIYVGNLDFAVTESDLRDLFRAHGFLESVALVRDRDSGHSRCFAFIEMPNDSEAKYAIEALNGTEFHQRTLSINEARPKHETLNEKEPGERRTHIREALNTRRHRQHRY